MNNTNMNNTNTNNEIISNNRNNGIIGGKVIASGGFGCIFEPELKCKFGMGSSDKRNYNKITKLMTVKNAKKEYNTIQRFKNVLTKVPNYSNYFLIEGFYLCEPDKLTKSDLENFNKKCKALKKKGITVKNINSSLDKLNALNMPNGGIDVSKYLKQNISPQKLIDLNNSLIDLLINGIVPMNKLKVYHFDIKDSNILVKESNGLMNTRLIDWGLSVYHDVELKNNIIAIKRGRPFQYNTPFSIILFNSEFIKRYNHFIKKNPNPNYYLIREFVVNFIFIWNKIRGVGHLNTINRIIKNFTYKNLFAIEKKQVKEHFIEYNFTYYYIVEYITKILLKFTVNNEFKIIDYYNQVFLKIVDIWGFLMVYETIYERLYEKYNNLNYYEIQFINKIKYIFFHFLYESPTNEINIEELVNELTNLNVLISKFDMVVSYKRKENIKTRKITTTNKNKTRKNE